MIFGFGFGIRVTYGSDDSVLLQDLCPQGQGPIWDDREFIFSLYVIFIDFSLVNLLKAFTCCYVIVLGHRQTIF